MNIAATQFTLAHNSFEIYLSGCTVKCKGCQNAELGDFDYGIEGREYLKEFKVREKIKEFDILINKIVILGGEPLDQTPSELLELLIELKKLNIELGLFTSYEKDDIIKNNDSIKNHIIRSVDYVKYGKYIQELETDNNIHFGYKLATSNQYIIKNG